MSDLHMRLYTLIELTKMLTAAGLTLERVYGGFRGEEYGLNTRRMIVVAENARNLQNGIERCDLEN